MDTANHLVKFNNFHILLVSWTSTEHEYPLSSLLALNLCLCWWVHFQVVRPSLGNQRVTSICWEMLPTASLAAHSRLPAHEQCGHAGIRVVQEVLPRLHLTLQQWCTRYFSGLPYTLYVCFGGSKENEVMMYHWCLCPLTLIFFIRNKMCLTETEYFCKNNWMTPSAADLLTSCIQKPLQF